MAPGGVSRAPPASYATTFGTPSGDNLHAKTCSSLAATWFDRKHDLPPVDLTDLPGMRATSRCFHQGCVALGSTATGRSRVRALGLMSYRTVLFDPLVVPASSTTGKPCGSAFSAPGTSGPTAK